MAEDDLPRNLKLLCSHYRSVAEVCRRIGVNRQQFNKYLSGQASPSIYNLRRIADFFGVEEGELLISHEEFVETVISRPNVHSTDELSRFVAGLSGRFVDSQNKLKPYCGYYHSYIRSPAYPELVIRALVTLYQHQGHTHSKTIERLNLKTKRHSGLYICKYEGVVLYDNDRIYLAEYESKLSPRFAFTTLYPTNRSTIILVNGLCLSVTGNHARQPFAAQTVFEYLGPTVNVREALHDCRLLDPETDEIDPEIRRRIGNDTGAPGAALRAADY